MKFSLFLTFTFLCGMTGVHAQDFLPDLSADCYQEWQSRGWVIGEDNTPAYEVPRFANGIKKMCETRADMHSESADISPYIQGRLAELVPYLFAGDEAAMRSLVKKLQQRRPGPDFSGAFMRD
jgi:hypothetical protein